MSEHELTSFIAEEKAYLEENLLPAFADREGYEVEELEDGDGAAEGGESNSRFFRVYERKLPEYFFRDEFEPQYGLVDEVGDYALAVELRGTLTVEARDEEYEEDARRLAEQWQDEIGLLWSHCSIDRFDHVLEEL